MADAINKFEIEHFGQAGRTPIVMLHEGLGSVAMWKDFPQKLADEMERHIIAWSRQGYGSSGDFDSDYGVDFMHREADVADRLLSELGIERAHIFGHSDGASIALLLAARYPNRVATLTLEAPHVFVEQICLNAIHDLKQDVCDNDMIERMGKYHRDAGAVFRQWSKIWTDPSFERWNIEAELSDVDLPTLLIQGEDDAFGSFEQLDRVATIIPDSRQLRLPQCDHSPHRDQQDEVLKAVASFLKDCEHD
tara:strand:+ start:84002 stop:84751 length:750 start_codon:yes stop_codon:yes gene_type:complete